MKGAINYPVSRHGRICKADTDFSDADSRLVARKIENSGHLFLSTISGCLDELGAEHRIAPNEDVILYNEQPPIISFPSFDVKVSKFHLTSRVSLTVCQYGRRSKIWSRASLVRCNDRPAFEMSESLTSEFFHLASTISQLLIERVYSEYKKTIVELGVATDLTELYDFCVRGVNLGDRRFKDILNGLSDLSIPYANHLLYRKEYYRVLSTFFRVALKGEGVSQKKLQKLEADPDFDLSFLEGDHKDRPVSSVVLARPKKHITLLDCVCFNDKLGFGKSLQADLASKELVQEYASRF